MSQRSQPQYCGPCHRARGLSGPPGLALPLDPATAARIDAEGGVLALCDGAGGHRVRVNTSGEPYAVYAHSTPHADESVPVPGHTLFAFSFS